MCNCFELYHVDIMFSSVSGKLDLPQVDPRVSKQVERAFKAAKGPSERRSRERSTLPILNQTKDSFRKSTGKWTCLDNNCLDHDLHFSIFLSA